MDFNSTTSTGIEALTTIVNPTTNTSMNISSNTTADSLPSMPSVFETVIMYIICLGAIFSNMMVLFTLPHLKGKIRTQTRYCMISLVITDSVLGSTKLVSTTVFMTNIKAYMDYICFAEGILAGFLVDMTIVGLTLLNADRIFVILLPAKYEPWMSKRKFKIILVALWLLFTVRFAVAASLPKTQRHYLEGAYLCVLKYDTNKVFTSVSILVILVVPFLNCVASLLAFIRILKRRAKTNISKNSKSKESTTVLSAIFLLTTAYFFMTAPFSVCVLVNQAFFDNAPNKTANFVTTWLLACNSVVNPYIYLATMKSYRQEFCRSVSRLVGIKKDKTPNLDDSRFSTHDDNDL